MADPGFTSNGSTTFKTDPRGTGEITLQALSMCLILLSGILGNSLILLAIYIDKTLQTLTNAFVVNLAIADLLLAISGMPFTLVSSITYEWIFGPVWCDINGMANSLFCVASMLTLAAVSIDRYIAIIHPLKYTSYMTNRTAAGMIIYIWVHSLIIALLPVLGWSQYTFLRKESICTVYWELDISCTIFIFVVCFFFPFAIMIFTYSRVLKTAWKQSKRIVPITGRFSERKRHEERLDSSTCEPISVGSMDSTNRLSHTGSTIVHNSLSTEEHFKFSSEKLSGKEILDNKINKLSMNVDESRKYPYEELETKEQAELVNDTQEFNGANTQVDNASVNTKNDSLTSGDSTNIKSLTAQYSPNFVDNTKEVVLLEENESSMTFNLDTKTQLIANHNTIKISDEPCTQQKHAEDIDVKSDGISKNGGVQRARIVYKSANYSQMKPSSKQYKVKSDVISNNNNNNNNDNQHSDSWSQISQDLSDDVFLPLENKTSKTEENNKTIKTKAQNDDTSKARIEIDQTGRNEIKDNVKTFADNKLPPLRTVKTKGSRNELPSATPQLKIDVVESSGSPSHSPQALPKRRRVTVATCHPDLQKVAESDDLIQNGLLSRDKNAVKKAAIITNSTPCLQNSNSMSSLRVDKPAKRKLSGLKRPNIAKAFRKKSINPNGLLRMKQEHKAVRTLLIVVGTFVICWLPHFIGIFCILSKECTWPDSYFAITTWLAMLNSGCNPIIYGAMSRQFRKRFRQIIQCKRGFF